MWKAGLINESQLGAVVNGGRARFNFAHNDLLVSSGTAFSRSARSDTSTRFEAGKQAGPDTIEHFMGGGAEGQAMMANWLRGGFEMDRKGEWRLKPQVADTLQRDVQAVMTQTGWTRSISRSATHQVSQGTEVGGQIGGSASRTEVSDRSNHGRSNASHSGRTSVQLSASSRDFGSATSEASARIDIVNYDVREAISHAERAASRAADPARAFSVELGQQILGGDGLRNRYLEQADSGRGMRDWSAPLTSAEQRQILDTGRFSGDLDHGRSDGDSEFKKR